MWNKFSDNLKSHCCTCSQPPQTTSVIKKSKTKPFKLVQFLQRNMFVAFA